MKKLIYIGSDHAGFSLKEKLKKFLIKKGYKIEDLGANKYVKRDDYPDYAVKVAKKVKKNNGLGILICGTGQGINIAANKIKGIRAALCWNEVTAKIAKKHLNANIISIGARVTSLNTAKNIVRVWLNTPFKKIKRHIRRIKKIK